MPHIPSAERLVRQRADALTRRLDAARSGDVHGIHQARVATRRLRAALPLLSSSGRLRRIAEAARKLTRALGPVRELDVSLDGLSELERAQPHWRNAVTFAREMLFEDRRAVLRAAIRRIDKWDSSRIRRAARRADTRTAPAGAARDPRAERLALLKRRARRRALQLHDALDRAAGVYLPERLHAVRLAVKKLRYVLEIRQQLAGGPMVAGGRLNASPRSAAGRIAVLRQGQELLGRLHDREMLILRLRAAQGTLDGPRLELAGDLESMIRFLETECRRLHGQYMAVRPRLLGVASRETAATSPRRAPAA